MTKGKKQPLNFKKNHFEKDAWGRGFHAIGIDEVGRGCLAGPVVTGAVILPIGKLHPLLKDSKLMDHETRLKAYAWITKHCAYQVALVHNRLIDQHNIWQATLIAMKKALTHLLAQPIARPATILVDAMPLSIKDLGIDDMTVYYFNKGESKSSSIAAASIVAKVTRDLLMEKFDRIIPGYHLEKHKGYSTGLHIESLKDHRPSIIHRTTFLSSFTPQLDTDETDEQQRFC